MELAGFFRISFQERLDVRGLIQHEAVFGIRSKQVQRLQNVRKTLLEIFLPGLEDGALPLRVRDQPKRSRTGGTGNRGPGGLSLGLPGRARFEAGLQKQEPTYSEEPQVRENAFFSLILAISR